MRWQVSVFFWRFKKHCARTAVIFKTPHPFMLSLRKGCYLPLICHTAPPLPPPHQPFNHSTQRSPHQHACHFKIELTFQRHFFSFSSLELKCHQFTLRIFLFLQKASFRESLLDFAFSICWTRSDYSPPKKRSEVTLTNRKLLLP